MADKKGTGLLMVWVDVPADQEHEFNHWYNEEHLPELLAVPGVLSAARYEAVSSGPKHLACYELESSAVVDTDAFKNRPTTEWAQRVGPRAISTTLINNVYEMVHPAGLTPEIAQSGMAEALQIGRMGISPENEEEWNRWVQWGVRAQLREGARLHPRQAVEGNPRGTPSMAWSTNSSTKGCPGPRSGSNSGTSTRTTSACGP